MTPRTISTLFFVLAVLATIFAGWTMQTWPLIFSGVMTAFGFMIAIGGILHDENRP